MQELRPLVRPHRADERGILRGDPGHKGRTCKEIGAIALWNKNKSEDEVFKIYRREYKKRFAWIKAGRITDEQFYAWSEQAREMKKKCDREVITLEEFKDWLGKP